MPTFSSKHFKTWIRKFLRCNIQHPFFWCQNNKPYSPQVIKAVLFAQFTNPFLNKI